MVNRKNISKLYKRLDDQKQPGHITVPNLQTPCYHVTGESSHEVLSYFHLQAVYVTGTLTSPSIDVPDVTFITGAIGTPAASRRMGIR
jgi:hypothetical protein